MNPAQPRLNSTAVGFVDAHNHLQDERFAGQQLGLMASARAAGVAGMVVNGSGEDDWPRVAALAEQFTEVIPSYGCHPWYLNQRTPQWFDLLQTRLQESPDAGVGEIGLDRWMIENPERWRAMMGSQAADIPPTLADQAAAFGLQLRLAAELNRAASIHCLQAFGRLRELLATTPRPARGFLLHSYGGPPEMIPEFAKLGAYFSFPGYFAHERKVRQRDTFRSVPIDRLLIETDAPDQLPPPALQRFALKCADSALPLNHPANLGAIYEFVAQLREVPLAELNNQIRENFNRLFCGS